MNLQDHQPPEHQPLPGQKADPYVVAYELSYGLQDLTASDEATIEATAVLLCRLRQNRDSFTASEFGQLQKGLDKIKDLELRQANQKYFS